MNKTIFEEEQYISDSIWVGIKDGKFLINCFDTSYNSCDVNCYFDSEECEQIMSYMKQYIDDYKSKKKKL